MRSASPKTVSQNPHEAGAFGVSSDKANFLFETIVCGLQETALQISTLTLLLREVPPSGAHSKLRSFRHLLIDDAKSMALGLSYGRDIGLSDLVVAKLETLYRDLAAAKRRVAPLIGSVSATTERSGASSLADPWRRLANDASSVIDLLLEVVRTRLGEIYEHDLRSTQQFLKLATEGNRNLVDEWGRLRLPPLKQRRTSPRMPVSEDCTLILAGGAYPARLEDVSTKGMAIVCAAAAGVGAHVAVELKDKRRLEGAIVRRQGDRIGLQLTRALAPNDRLFAASAAQSLRAP